MRLYRFTLTLCFIIQISCLSACSNQPRTLSIPSLHKSDEQSFNEEKTLALAQDPRTNFDALRFSYTQTSAYQPWASREHQAGLLLLEAQEEGDFELCLALADAILKNNFTSLLGHFGSASCNLALGNSEESTFHAWVLQGLIDSIRSSGNGETIESAYICYSPTEMRDFVRMLDLLMYRQEYVGTGSKQIERIYAIDTHNDENVTLYFDTSAARLHSFKTNIEAPTLLHK